MNMTGSTRARRRGIALLAALALGFGSAGCGDDSDSGGSASARTSGRKPAASSVKQVNENGGVMFRATPA